MAVYEEISKGWIDRLIRLLEKQLELLKAMAQDSKNKKIYRDEGDDGIKTLLRHIKGGKNVKVQEVNAEDAALFEALLKSQGVPYVSFLTGEGDDKKCIFMTRDSDAGALDDVWRKFQMEMSLGMTEMPVSEFINCNQGQDIKRSLGYDAVEVEVFRRKMAEHPAPYAVIESDKYPGKFDIMYLPKDFENIDRSLKDMNYELSGERGEEYQKSLKFDIRQREHFEGRIHPKNGETIYIVDTKNPNNFISVNNTGFAVHSLKAAKKELKNGDVQHVVRDPNVIKSNIYDKDRIMHYAEGLTKPVILTQEEMKLVKGIGPDGSAIVANHSDYKKVYSDFKKELSLRNDVYNGLSRRMVEHTGRTYTLKNLPNDKLNELYDALKKQGLDTRISVVNDSIAYSEKDKVQFEAIADSILYEGMSPLVKEENKLYYEGHGNIELQNPTDTKYIISAKDPDFVLRIKPEGLDVIKDGAVARSISHDDKDYEPLLKKLVSSIKEPAVLTEEEMKMGAAEKTALINEKRTINIKSEAKDYLDRIDLNKKVELYQVKDPAEARTMDLRQKEAVDRHFRHETVDNYVDRTFTEKMLDMDISGKLKQESRTTEEKSRGIER